MSHKNIVESVLKIIEKQHIQPRPKWEFMLKKYFTWTLTAITLIIGSLSFAVIIYLIKNNDWDLYKEIPDSLPQFILLTLPYFWLIFLILFILLIYYNFKHTKQGYKYGFNLIIGSTILLSILAGTFFYNLGLGQVIDKVFDERIPIYRQLMLHRHKAWHQPDKGLLFGTIETAPENYQFKLRDLEHKSWLIIYSADNLPRPIILIPGMRIKALGHQIDQDSFQADILRFLRPSPDKMFFMRLRHMAN